MLGPAIVRQIGTTLGVAAFAHRFDARGAVFEFRNLAEGIERRVGEQVRRRFGKRSEEHTSELQSQAYLVCRLLLEKKKKNA